jgi:gliding motility-associated-like protein
MVFRKKLISILIPLVIGTDTLFAQIITASKTLVCPNEPTQLTISDNALQADKFCVSKLGERFGFHYFRTCNQVTVYEAIIMAKMMNGFLATGNDEDKNNYLFNRLPNDIHWIGYFQNPKAKTFNDPPDPNSGFEWMSKAPLSRPYWVEGEPNNFEDTNPGRFVVQGCRRDPRWCDVDDIKRYVGIIESTSETLPNVTNPTILWETGETTQSITVAPSKSKYYKVTIFYGTRTVEDSILIETPKVEAEFSKPGGCNPYKWKPVLISNAPDVSLEINWKFGNEEINNQLKPEFLAYQDGFISGSVNVKSKECNIDLLNQSEVFELYPMKAQPLKENIIKLNEVVSIEPVNEGPFKYLWSPSAGLSDANIFMPEFAASRDVKYEVLITDDFGCSVKEEFKYIIDLNLSIFVPEAFSPNGDKLNDDFEINTIKDFYGKILSLEIFNNWGERIHLSETDNPKWDGTFNGSPLPPGVYFYIIKFEVLGKNYEKRGTIYLLK